MKKKVEKRHKGRPTNGRKMMVSILLTKEDIIFLDSRIDYSQPLRNSRSAVMRYLISIVQKEELT